jgi:hypothetical protein
VELDLSSLKEAAGASFNLAVPHEKAAADLGFATALYANTRPEKVAMMVIQHS